MPTVFPLEPAITRRGSRLRLVSRGTRAVGTVALTLGILALIGLQAGMLHALGWTRPRYYDVQDVIICDFGDVETTASMHGSPEEADLSRTCQRFGEPLRGQCLAALAAVLSTEGHIRPTPVDERVPDLGIPITDEEIAARIARDPVR